MAPSGVSEELSSLLAAVGEMRQSNKLSCVRHKQDYAQQHVAHSAGPEAVSVHALLPAPADHPLGDPGVLFSQVYFGL